MTDMGKKKHGHLTPQEELKVVALLARGDTIVQIQQYFRENDMRPIHDMTIASIRKRNKENLDLIKAKMLAKEAEDAMAIKDKANSAIKQRLDRDEQQGKILEAANKRFLSGEIEIDEYTTICKRVKQANIAELVAVSREMFAQSRETTDDDKITTQKDLSELVKAIKSGDEVKLQQIVFNANSK